MALQMVTPQINVEIPGMDFPQVNDTSVTTLDRETLFAELDGRVRNIEARLKATWLELGNLCLAIKKQQLWRDGGYDSYGQWLANACPFSRSYAYAAVGAREALSDVSEDDLKQIPLGNAITLQKTPRNRRDGDLIDKAKRQPLKQFLQTVVDDIPEAHLEETFVHKFRLSKSAGKVLCAGLDAWRILNDDPEAPVECALEGLIADYMQANQAALEKKLAGKRGRA